MPSIKEYDVKLKSLRNTQKMVKTMKMVSASKLRRAQEAQRNSAAYAEKLTSMISRLSASVPNADHPLLDVRPATRTLVIVFTSDRGLCGGFNNNLAKFVQKWVEQNKSEIREIELSFCGRRGFSYFRRRQKLAKNYEDVTAAPNFDTAEEIGEAICDQFIAGDYDEVYLAFNTFLSPLAQEPTLFKLLPVGGEVMEGGDAVPSDYIFEPPCEEMLKMLVPRTVYYKLYHTFLENAAGEHGARMTAMDNATNNASDLIESYTLLRNRARQAAITTELTEIVAGAEAL